MKKNVLIFSGATYPAIQIIDCLKNSPRFHIIAASSYPNHSEFVCDDVIVNLPFVGDINFIDEFKNLLMSRNIEYVIPTDETIALILKKHENELPAVIVCSPYETTLLCRYKKLLFKALREESYTPKIYESDEIESIFEYPVFVKPNSSQGSKGAQIINCREDFDLVDNLEDMVICEYLPGEEYTVDCFTNKDGEVIFCNPRVRTRLMNGITARGKNVPCTEEFKFVVNELNLKVKFRGYWFVQLRRDNNGKLKLLEICTRFAGSFAISKGKGVNLPLLALCDFSGLETNVIENNYIVECDKTYIDRYRLNLNYSHLYVDYDDTITLKNGKIVNSYVMAYLYQCKAKNIKITLLTRHEDSYKESLCDSFKRLHISPELFDDIVELTWNQSKYEFIKDSKNSIFLDNSFKERKEIHDRLGMSVFDVCNIDCLFDWRF